MKEIKKNTNDYVQVTRGYMKSMRELSNRSNAAFQILWLLTERMNRTNAVVISQAAISEILGVGRTTVHKAVSILKEEKWVQVVKIGTANAYVVNSKVVWRANNRDGKRFATFHADIIATASEQPHPIEQWDDIELKQIPVMRKKEIPVPGNEELPPPDQLDLIDNTPEESPLIRQANPDQKHRVNSRSNGVNKAENG